MKDYSEPAFPGEKTVYEAGYRTTRTEPVPGMTLRDYFAAKALATVCAYSIGDVQTWSVEDFARHVYEIADAMLVERAK